eukprot:5967766-Prymnesium_polylepis.2
MRDWLKLKEGRAARCVIACGQKRLEARIAAGEQNRAALQATRALLGRHYVAHFERPAAAVVHHRKHPQETHFRRGNFFYRRVLLQDTVLLQSRLSNPREAADAASASSAPAVAAVFGPGRRLTPTLAVLHCPVALEPGGARPPCLVRVCVAGECRLRRRPSLQQSHLVAVWRILAAASSSSSASASAAAAAAAGVLVIVAVTKQTGVREGRCEGDDDHQRSDY